VAYADGRKDTYAYEKGDYVVNADPSLNQFTANANGLAERTTVIHGTTAAANGVAFKTTKETTIHDQAGHTVYEETYVYNGAGYERSSWLALDYDNRGHVLQTRDSKGQVTTAVWNGDLKSSETDALGVQIDYTYDALNRVKTQTKKGIAAGGGFPAQADITITFNYDAASHQIGQTISSGSLTLSSSRSYDLAGRIKSETDNAQLTASYTYANGGRTQTVVLPGGATRITDKYLDGQTKSVTGTAVIAHYSDYGVNGDGTSYTQEFVGSGGLSSPRWIKTTTDWLGRNVAVEKPTFSGATLLQSSIYNALGQLQKQTITSGANKLMSDQLYEYDQLGQQIRAGLDVDANSSLTLLSTDRVTEMDMVYEKVGADWFRVTSARNYFTDNNDTPVVEIQRTRLNNFVLNGTEQTVSETTLTDVAGNNFKTTITVDRTAKKQTTTTDPADSNINAVSISVNGRLQSSSTATPQSAATWVYDSLGRPTSVTDPRTGTTTRSYSATTGQLISSNDGAGGTSYDYYPATHNNAGQLKAQTNAAGKKVFFNYNSRGELVQTWGDTTYPLEYVYDTYGQRTELHTFRGGQGWTASTWPASMRGAADITTWTYQAWTGALIQKQDATLRGGSYTYDELGRLKTRTWARGITCTYNYDPNTGEMISATYSDSTPAVAFAYDRGGRQKTITDAAGTRARSFNVAGDLQTEQITGGILDLVQVTSSFDSFLRRESLQASRGATALTSQTYAYDPTSRLQSVTSGGQTATYAYYSTSGLLNTTTFNGGTNIARSYDPLGRLQAITTSPAGGGAQSYTYTYNNLNQRTRVTREDSSYWSYVYNDRGELVSGKKYWADNAPVWGAQTEYSFDNIGNRTSAKNGGNQFGALRTSSYTANSLNQYSQRSVPGAVDITGAANAAATVSVNDQATVRKGDYLYKELAIDNGAAPVYADVKVVGARNNFGAGGEDAVTAKGGRVFIPQAVESFAHDADGNLVSDGRWNYTWDGENRLISMEANANVPVEAKQRLEFSYDYMSRRIQKNVYVWNTGTSNYQLQTTSRFVYDGWNLIAEFDGTNNPVRSYIWAGPQLAIINAGADAYQVAYDGNADVVGLVKASTGTLAASYDYDPFGQTLKAVGEYATQNPLRFSSQYTDVETGLLYYGYRYYNPQSGTWINRDPAEEGGGTNLYGFVNNDGINAVDYLGLWKKDGWSGGWFSYFGHATAEKCDKLSDLAKFITGVEDDWRILKHREKVEEGEVIDITPLLRTMESRLRTSVRRAAGRFNAKGFPSIDEQGTSDGTGWVTSGEPQSVAIGRFFNRNRPYGLVGCDDAASIILSQGLIDVIGASLYEEILAQMGGDVLGIFKRRDGRIGTMLEGDSGWLPNYEDYQGLPRFGDYGHENSIKLAQNLYYGHPLGRFNIQKLERLLQKEYVEAGGRSRRDPIPGLHNREDVQITFIDVAKVFGIAFDLRRR
jgi:RHS repeat-associated protein